MTAPARRTLVRSLTARGLTERPGMEKQNLGSADSASAKTGERNVFVEAAGKLAPAGIYDFEKLVSGNTVSGPAVIHTPITTIVLQDKQTGRMDEYRNMIIEFASADKR